MVCNKINKAIKQPWSYLFEYYFSKLQAELIHMRAELVESKSKRELLEKELHNLLLHLHSTQLSQLPNNITHNKHDTNFKPDVNNIKKKMQDELKKSPTHFMKSNVLAKAI